MLHVVGIGDDLFEAFFADEEPEKKKKPEAAADDEPTSKPAVKKTNKKKRVTSTKKTTSTTAKPETSEFQHTPALLDLAAQSDKKDSIVSSSWYGLIKVRLIIKR